MKNYVKLLCLTIFCLSLFACDSFYTEDVEFIEPKPIINKDISHIKFENLRPVKNVDISGVGGYIFSTFPLSLGMLVYLILTF